ncbi:BnaCnng32760D [Brassica napus]|uniref:BnaCnng32760D protein n=1 Tax=Brassica napus TaxID=3708 RepID=A0A078IZU9_BRANA|nr:BnaCnng32760D [Brassica napus]
MSFSLYYKGHGLMKLGETMPC